MTNIDQLHDTGLRRAVAEKVGYYAQEESDGLWSFFGPHGRIPAGLSESVSENDCWEYAMHRKLVPEYERTLDAIIPVIGSWSLALELEPGRWASVRQRFSQGFDSGKIGGDAARVCRAFLKWAEDNPEEFSWSPL